MFEYEDPTKLMLRFNALFAQSQLGIDGWQEEVRRTNVQGAAVRYKILQKTLLSEWEGIETLVREALKTRDMTRKELEDWPALKGLRDHGILSKAFAAIESEAL